MLATGWGDVIYIYTLHYNDLRGRVLYHISNHTSYVQEVNGFFLNLSDLEVEIENVT